MARPLSTSDILEGFAGELHGLAFDFSEPSRSAQRAERLIADVERIAAGIRAAVRGRG